MSITIAGRDHLGLIAEGEGMRWYVTDCCRASATGVQVTEDNPAGVACHSCYRPVDPRLGGLPAQPGGVSGEEALEAALAPARDRAVAKEAFARVGGQLPDSTTITRVDPGGLFLAHNTEEGAAPDNRYALIFDDYPLTRFTSGTGFMRWRKGIARPVGYMHRGGGRAPDGALSDFLPEAAFAAAQELAVQHLPAVTA